MRQGRGFNATSAQSTSKPASTFTIISCRPTELDREQTRIFISTWIQVMTKVICLLCSNGVGWWCCRATPSWAPDLPALLPCIQQYLKSQATHHQCSCTSELLVYLLHLPQTLQNKALPHQPPASSAWGEAEKANIVYRNQYYSQWQIYNVLYLSFS